MNYIEAQLSHTDTEYNYINPSMLPPFAEVATVYNNIDGVFGILPVMTWKKVNLNMVLNNTSAI